MWIRNLALLLLVGLSLAESEAEAEAEAQEEAATGKGTLRRLRLRRPRPVSISDPDGIAEGRPIPLRRIPQGVPVDQLVSERQNTADLLAAALDAGDDDLQFEQGQSLQSTDALASLLATAAAASPAPEPFIPEYEDLADEQLLQPIAAVPQQRQQQVQQQQAEAPRGRVPSGRTRRPPGVPRRVRPRPDNEQKGQRQPNVRDRENSSENVGTVERYSHTNDDGSFTFGYISADGSFREETRGSDCITRGKYGYIDPDGKKREFTYVSGLPCDITDEENLGSDEDNNLQREDPINPNDRFRTSAAVQLSDDEIPNSARPRQRIPQAQRPVAPQQPQQAPQPQRNPQIPQRAPQPQQQFNNFQQQPQRAPATFRDPGLLNRAPAQPAQPAQQQPGALQNLFNIVQGQEATPIPPVTRPQRPPQTLAPVTRPRPQPQTPRPTPQSPPRPASAAFDFDSELDSFTLNKPAITFDEPAPSAEQEAAAKPNFSTELVFDPASGTFKTELRQALPNGEEVRVSNDAQQAGSPAPTPAPTPSALPPTSGPFTAFSPTTIRPTTPRPPQSPTPSSRPRPTQPGAPSPSSPFTPLTFPSPAPTTPRPASPSTIAPERPRAAQQASPRPTQASTATTFAPSPSPSASPSPVPGTPGTGSFFFQPFPTAGSPRPATQEDLNRLANPPPPGQPRPAIGQPQRLPANAGAVGGQSPAGFPAGTFPITNQPQSRPPPGFGQPQSRPPPGFQQQPQSQLPPGFNGQPLGQPQARPPPGFPQNTQFIQQPRPGTPIPGTPRPGTPQPTLAASPSPRPQQPTQARPVPFTVFNNNFNLGRPAGAPAEAPRAAQGTPAPSPTPLPASPAPVQASPSPRPVQASPSPFPVTPQPSAGRPVTPQVQFGFQPIQTATGQPAQRPTQFSPQPQRPPPGFQFQQPGQPQRPPPGFAPQQFQQRPQGPPQGPPRPAQAGAPQNRPFTAFSGGIPQQLQFGQPQAQRPQQLGIPPQLAGQQQPGGRFQPFGRPPPGAPQRPQGPPQQQRPQSSSPFTVFNPSLLRGARHILSGR